LCACLCACVSGRSACALDGSHAAGASFAGAHVYLTCASACLCVLVGDVIALLMILRLRALVSLVHMRVVLVRVLACACEWQSACELDGSQAARACFSW
jgi:hypothetical protein